MLFTILVISSRGMHFDNFVIYFSSDIEFLVQIDLNRRYCSKNEEL